MAANAFKEFTKSAWKWFKGTNISMSASVAARTMGTSPGMAIKRAIGGNLSLKAAMKHPNISKVGSLGTKRGVNFSSLAGKERSAAIRKGAEVLAGQERQRAPGMIKQYLWPGQYNSAWEGTGMMKNIHVPENKVGMTRLRRAGGLGLAAWSAGNIARPGDQIGPF